MSRWLAVVSLLILLLGGSFPSAAQARIKDSWPYEKLRRQADLIVIVHPTATADVNGQPKERPPADYLVPVVTEFEVDTVFGMWVDNAESLCR